MQRVRGVQSMCDGQQSVCVVRAQQCGRRRPVSCHCLLVRCTVPYCRASLRHVSDTRSHAKTGSHDNTTTNAGLLREQQLCHVPSTKRLCVVRHQHIDVWRVSRRRICLRQSLPASFCWYSTVFHERAYARAHPSAHTRQNSTVRVVHRVRTVHQRRSASVACLSLLRRRVSARAGDVFAPGQCRRPATMPNAGTDADTHATAHTAADACTYAQSNSVSDTACQFRVQCIRQLFAVYQFKFNNTV